MNYEYKVSQNKKLRKDKHNGKLAGVCAGLGLHFKVPNLAVRIIAVLSFITFPQVVGIAYLIAALVLPSR